MKSLYEDDQKQNFAHLFREPGAIYRDAPFWAWNGKLEPEKLKRQIGIFHEMKMGGFFMHPRTGLATPYLSDKFMDMVEVCVKEAQHKNMFAYLYDEDRWPSGSAGGTVTENPEFRSRHLLLSFRQPVENTCVKFLAAFEFSLDKEGYLNKYRRVGIEKKADNILYASRVIDSPDPWFNGNTYLDTLNPDAVKAFLNSTHERYWNNLENYFGSTIQAIFTDEPQHGRKVFLRFPHSREDVILPWTDDLPETFFEAFQDDLLNKLPELLWELPDGRYSRIRYLYHRHVGERLAQAFSDQVGEWCEQHNIRFTGHMMGEARLDSQSCFGGESMRHYRKFQIPGIDMLCDRLELTTAKQAQSVSRQFGRQGVLSELDGVTNWDFPFMGHKGHGDWQAALGVTLRVPHLSHYTLAGEAKRDYPASIGSQSPWYRLYPILADHFARVNVAMTRGKPVVRVAVLHPVESYYLVSGPFCQTADDRRDLEDSFHKLHEYLLHGLIDFDLISESLLPFQYRTRQDKGFQAGEMVYEVLLVPPMLTMRKTTLEYLDEFADRGGRILFAGNPPFLCEAEPSERPKRLAWRCETVPFSRSALLTALKPCRDVNVAKTSDGMAPETLLYQLREYEGNRILFLVNTERYGEEFEFRLAVKGCFRAELLNTFTGGIELQESWFENGFTIITGIMQPHGHLLLRYTPALPRKIASSIDADKGNKRIGNGVGGSCTSAPGSPGLEKRIAARLENGPFEIQLDEPNVLVLDYPRWKLEGGNWQQPMEILRLDNQIRKEWNLPSRTGRIAQPWTMSMMEKEVGNLELAYSVNCKTLVRNAVLAMENPHRWEIFLDGQPIAVQDTGCWVDEAIRRIPLPTLAKGEHRLELKCNFRNSDYLERCFILGKFGVKVRGHKAEILPEVKSLEWGDVVQQGFPFYSGNITYRIGFELGESGDFDLRMPSRVNGPMPLELRSCAAARECRFTGYMGTMLTAVIDQRNAGHLAFAPFTSPLGFLEKGEHQLELKLFGSRVNSMGAIHLAFPVPWMGPGAWRTEGDLMTAGYHLQPFGIMLAPLVIKR